MAQDDDPFATPFDTEKTVIRPTPGRRRPQPPSAAPPTTEAAGPPPSPAAEAELRAEIARIGVNSLVAAALPLLVLSSQLRYATAQGNVEELHRRIVREIRSFEERIERAGTPKETVEYARYVLCAMVDDVVLNTPWGQNSLWPTTTIVSTIYKETYAGRRFFDLLVRLERDPAHNIDVLELMYLCLSLGFEGELRIDPRGPAEHARIRDALFRTIRTARGEFERELSPKWRGIDARHRPLASYIPIWVIAVCAAVLALGTYAGFSLALSGASDVAVDKIAGLPPTGEVQLARQVPPPSPAPIEKPSGIRAFLAPEIAQNLVTVTEDARAVTVRIIGTAFFASGSDAIADRYGPLLKRIGEALDSEPGKVVVTGHTDSTPVRSLRFPSNWHLSVARAKSVGDMVSRYMREPNRLTTEGRGDTEPAASNATDAGRALNRRIELVLMKAS